MTELEEAIVGDAAPFRSFRVGFWGADAILQRSRGEVKKPETINYRTFRPEKDGLLDEAIFGKLGSCSCGKEPAFEARRRAATGAKTCGSCGAEVPAPKGRRRRMGHVVLSSPVAHPWFRSALARSAGLSPDQLEEVLLCERFVVLEPGAAPVLRGAVIKEEEWMALQESHSEAIRAGLGAEAVRELVKGAPACAAGPIANSFFTCLPVLPPELRPMVAIGGGRLATSGLLDLYRRLINRNNRLRRLRELNAPEIIIRNEVRMLQEAADALLDNEHRPTRVITGPPPQRAPLCSVTGSAGGREKILEGLLRFDRAILRGQASLNVPRRFRRWLILLRGLGLNLAPRQG